MKTRSHFHKRTNCNPLERPKTLDLANNESAQANQIFKCFFPGGNEDFYIDEDFYIKRRPFVVCQEGQAPRKW